MQTKEMMHRCVCDLCSCYDFEAIRMSSEEVRKLVEEGFNPYYPPPLEFFLLHPGLTDNQLAVAFGVWLERLEHDTTDWSFCPRCAKKLKPFQDKVAQFSKDV